VIVYTIGHSTRPIDDFLALLEREKIRALHDVRAFPGSRRHPQFNRESLSRFLEQNGIRYVHVPELGGRRRPRPDAPPTAWRNEGFAGYADYMRTDEFRAAIDKLIDAASRETTTIMCSEAVPWRCHRSLIADALAARGVEVRHILDASTNVHQITKFAVVHGTEVTYPPNVDQEELDLRAPYPRTTL